MKMLNLKWSAAVVSVVVIVCAITYAEKQEGKNVTLPDAVKNAIQAAYPQAAVEKAATEKEFKVFEVVIKQNDKEVELTVTPKGNIIDVETTTDKGKLPEAVSKALAKAAQGAEVKEVVLATSNFEIKEVKRDKPETVYEAELSKDGKECEVKIAPDGTIKEQSEWQKAEGKDSEKDEEEDEANEEKVTIEQVPAAVKAAILNEAGKGKVEAIDKEIKNGQTVYEADVIVDGKELEIKVSADGKIIDKKAEDKKD